MLLTDEAQHRIEVLLELLRQLLSLGRLRCGREVVQPYLRAVHAVGGDIELLIGICHAPQHDLVGSDLQAHPCHVEQRIGTIDLVELLNVDTVEIGHDSRGLPIRHDRKQGYHADQCGKTDQHGKHGSMDADIT